MKDDKLETISNLFEGREIRSIWDSEKEEYYFSVVDVIGALTDSNIPQKILERFKKKAHGRRKRTVRKYRTFKIKSSRWKIKRNRYFGYKRNFKVNRVCS